LAAFVADDGDGDPIVRLLAERKAGAMLAEMEKHPPGPDKEDRSHDVTDLPPSLDELGVTKMQSHRWQREATARQLAQQARERGLPLSVAADVARAEADGQRSPASQPGAVADDVAPPRGLGSSATTSRAIHHTSLVGAELDRRQTNKPR
jgi:hypothetical protein